MQKAQTEDNAFVSNSHFSNCNKDWIHWKQILYFAMLIIHDIYIFKYSSSSLGRITAVEQMLSS